MLFFSRKSIREIQIDYLKLCANNRIGIDFVKFEFQTKCVDFTRQKVLT